MGYRIRMVPEVAGWLGQLRDADPGTAGIVDEALAALRDEGSSLGPPLVIPVDVRPEPARPDLDQAYQRQLEMLARVRRAVAEMATARKRLELQTHQQEQAVTKLGEQRIKDLQAGRSDLAAEVGTRLPVVGAQLADLRNQYANVRSEEERLTVASGGCSTRWTTSGPARMRPRRRGSRPRPRPGQLRPRRPSKG